LLFRIIASGGVLATSWTAGVVWPGVASLFFTAFYMKNPTIAIMTRSFARVFVARETGSVCRDCVVELRGFEP
jgi:hypothetical protein